MNPQIQTSPTEAQPTKSPFDLLRDQIRLRAYELYELRGREDGHDVDDWLQAESDIVKPQRKAVSA
jgi:hypothetical protein